MYPISHVLYKLTYIFFLLHYICQLRTVLSSTYSFQIVTFNMPSKKSKVQPCCSTCNRLCRGHIGPTGLKWKMDREALTDIEEIIFELPDFDMTIPHPLNCQDLQCHIETRVIRLV